MPFVERKSAPFRWSLLFAGVFAALAGALAWQSHVHMDRHNRTLAQLDLDLISDSLKSWSTDSPNRLSPDKMAHLDARGLYELLSATNEGALFLGHQKEWDQHRELLDPWGRPFHIQVIPSPLIGGTTYPGIGVRIWSVGPNGKDERGHGDDITSQTVAVRCLSKR